MKEKRIIGRIVVILFIALFLTQSGQSRSGAQRVWATEPAAAEITDLTNLDQLKEVFQRNRGMVRLVALLSPI